ncbi:type VI secretion system lipoprotein TssJ [Cronobacter turicensis]|uniref:type VI secretion system lipoprotein TssJ n=1 Tax=Cronobacter turicensis TaxID=413502 RepID=UPI00137583B7|nr:type VI secretion system lipoprotein TssJ [Cronobacter turicensis]EKM0376126.1 type VI secretion system lipoprotein TssJ [Cronobacter turicensis]EKM5063251.1 type VI secretion system lipoprotein TssJ [Cronobacter turicensis]ELY7489131.1 type VI secretion system lipoprotein TssJ [Cronobacter turicensis]EMD9176070.1 type VI secretion system lipoprotein TssJ [Cronobacter turicensis]MDI6470585.1 type VI secretion system lipoprotein TssJ [Cronobacter turicensis]
MMTDWNLFVRAAELHHPSPSGWRACLFIALGMISACRSTPPDAKENKVALTLVAGANMNPNVRGVASPLKVFVYALTHDEAFLDAGYLTITGSPDPELKKEMHQLWEGILRPGETKHITVAVDDTTHALGIVAAYRDIQKAQWSETYRLTEKQPPAWYQSLWPWQTEAPAPTVNVSFDKLHITINGLNRENE